MRERIDEIALKLKGKDALESLKILSRLFTGQIAFSSSLGIEDQAITDLIFRNSLSIRIFTLDTGRLFEETYKTLQLTNQNYKTHVEVFYPQAASVEKLVSEHGPYSFYESVAKRKECCHIRKVEPLHRALEKVSLWVTGIRAEQSPNRHEMSPLEWDEAHGLFKFHPLLTWSLNDVKEFITNHNVPYNPLHDKGFVSIGCAPCTRAVREGENFRAGRWWWEDQSKKECGLHAR